MSKDIQAFSPLGPTIVISATGVAPVGEQAPASDENKVRSVGNYRFNNSSGSEGIWIGYGSTAAEAQANATAPAPGITKNFFLAPGATEILKFGQDTFFSGLANVATDFYIVPGEGL